MRHRKSRKLLPGLCVLLILGCSLQSKLADLEVLETGGEPCPIRISTVANSFKTAAHVKLMFTPLELKEIYVLEPLTDSFEALRYSPGETTNENRAKFGLANVDLKERKFRAHQISWGLPGFEWYSVGNFRQKGVFEVLPGKYRIRIRYSPDMSKRSRYLCFAETDTFVVEEKSLWVSTGE